MCIVLHCTSVIVPVLHYIRSLYSLDTHCSRYALIVLIICSLFSLYSLFIIVSSLSWPPASFHCPHCIATSLSWAVILVSSVPSLYSLYFDCYSELLLIMYPFHYCELIILADNPSSLYLLYGYWVIIRSLYSSYTYVIIVSWSWLPAIPRCTYYTHIHCIPTSE